MLDTVGNIQFITQKNERQFCNRDSFKPRYTLETGNRSMTNPNTKTRKVWSFMTTVQQTTEIIGARNDSIKTPVI